MKRQFSRIIAVVLAVACLLALAGCNDQAEPVDKTEGVSSSSEVSLVSSIVSESEVVSEPEAVSSETEPVSEKIVTPSEPESIVQDTSSQPDADLEHMTIWSDLGGVCRMKIFPADESATEERFSKLIEGKDFYASFIRDADELEKAGYACEAKYGELEAGAIDDFFEKYAILEVAVTNLASSDEPQFHFLTRDGNKLVVTWTLMPYEELMPVSNEFIHVPGTDDTTLKYYSMLVTKEYIEGVEEIVNGRAKITDLYNQ